MNISTFLDREGVHTEPVAVQWSVNAAVQRNRVYSSYERRAEFRAEWMRMLREESRRYHSLAEPVADSEHCGVIKKISNHLSTAFASSLKSERLRFGTSQKAFNLYLKYLWQLGEIPPPPHCPVDRIVLNELGIDEAWTRCDDQEQYMRWINAIRSRSKSLANWENDVFLRRVSK